MVSRRLGGGWGRKLFAEIRVLDSWYALNSAHRVILLLAFLSHRDVRFECV